MTTSVYSYFNDPAMCQNIARAVRKFTANAVNDERLQLDWRQFVTLLGSVAV